MKAGIWQALCCVLISFTAAFCTPFAQICQLPFGMFAIRYPLLAKDILNVCDRIIWWVGEQRRVVNSMKRGFEVGHSAFAIGPVAFLKHLWKHLLFFHSACPMTNGREAILHDLACNGSFSRGICWKLTSPFHKLADLFRRRRLVSYLPQTFWTQKQVMVREVGIMYWLAITLLAVLEILGAVWILVQQWRALPLVPSTCRKSVKSFWGWRSIDGCSFFELPWLQAGAEAQETPTLLRHCFCVVIFEYVWSVGCFEHFRRHSALASWSSLSCLLWTQSSLVNLRLFVFQTRFVFLIVSLT